MLRRKSFMPDLNKKPNTGRKAARCFLLCDVLTGRRIIYRGEHYKLRTWNG